MRTLTSESKILNKSAFELRRRRLNWQHAARDDIESHFVRVCDSTNESTYPFSMNCIVNNSTENEGTVQLSSSVNPTGIIERIDKQNTKSLKIDVEKGAALVASFGINGTITFIIYPYKSERYSTNEKDIILCYNLSPDDITDKLIVNCISKFFLYIRSSSIYGSYSLSLLDRLHIKKMVLIDIRNRSKIYRTSLDFLFEWSKIIFSGIVGGIAGYIVAILTRG